MSQLTSSHLKFWSQVIFVKSYKIRYSLVFTVCPSLRKTMENSMFSYYKTRLVLFFKYGFIRRFKCQIEDLPKQVGVVRKRF